MGMKLVGLVLTKWAPHLPDRALRVLLRMAFTALDEDNGKQKACMFFNGREPLMEVMRDEEKRDPKALNKAIQRAVKDLIQLGAIERVNRAYAGNRAEYRLTLESPIRIDGCHTVKKVKGDTQRPPQGDTQRPVRGTPSDPPRSNKEELRSNGRREVADLSGPVTLARANTKGKPEMEKKCEYDDCELGFRYDPTKPKGDRNYPCPICRPKHTPVIPAANPRNPPKTAIRIPTSNQPT